MSTLRWLLVALLAGHGCLHLLGAAKGLRWAEVPRLGAPIGTGAGLLWLVAAVVVIAAAVSLAGGAPTWWWALALVAAVASQLAVLTSWHDARAATVVNVVLLLAAGAAFVGEGPTSFHAEYRDRVAHALVDVDASPTTLTEADLVGLPDPLAAYVRRSGALGEPRVVGFRADFHGRIRSGPGAAWMPFTGHQVNTYGSRPQRLFLMDASRSGLPVTVLHVFRGGTATMRVKLLSLFPVVDAAGPEMDRGETVTLFNDLVVMAPGAIPDASVAWRAVDERHVRGTLTEGHESVSATLTFDGDHDLVDFVSDDRSRASADGTTFTRERWSTPLTGHREIRGHRVMRLGRGVWHAAGPDGTFTYLELGLDDVRYDVGNPD